LNSIGSTFKRMEPIYKTFPGWKKPTHKITNYKELPVEAQRYLDFIADELDCPVAIVSVGPTRDKTVVIEDPIHGPKRVLTKAVAE
jgi:adenylosuccinate synthase